jgi:hypothetical protein
MKKKSIEMMLRKFLTWLKKCRINAKQILVMIIVLVIVNTILLKFERNDRERLRNNELFMENVTLYMEAYMKMEIRGIDVKKIEKINEELMNLSLTEKLEEKKDQLIVNNELIKTGDPVAVGENVEILKIMARTRMYERIRDQKKKEAKKSRIK